MVPFTPIHAAVAVPLLRTPLVPSAVVAGAVAPDLPYYVPLTWIGGDYNLTLTHTWTSVLWLDAAIGLLLLVVFHALLKRPLLALAPDALARRAAPTADGFSWRSGRDAALVLASVVVGAATHLAWDALGDAFGYERSGAVNLVSDGVGAVVLVTWLALWWRSTATSAPVRPTGLTERERRAVVTAVVVATVAWAALRTVQVAREVSADLREYGGWSRSAVLDAAARETVTSAVVALALSVAVVAVLWHLRQVRGGRRRAGSGT